MNLSNDDITIKQHKTTGLWAIINLSDHQLEKCRHALKPSYSIGYLIRSRSSEIIMLQKMAVGEAKKAKDVETAQRLRVYISRIFGTGAGAYRKEKDHYLVWRVK